MAIQHTPDKPSGSSRSRRRSSALSFAATQSNAPAEHNNDDDDGEEALMSQRELDILQLLAEDDQRRASISSSSVAAASGIASGRHRSLSQQSQQQQQQQQEAIRRASIASFSSMASSSKFQQQQAWLASLAGGDAMSANTSGDYGGSMGMDGGDMDVDFMSGNGGGGVHGHANGNGAHHHGGGDGDMFGFGFDDSMPMSSMSMFSSVGDEAMSSQQQQQPSSAGPQRQAQENTWSSIPSAALYPPQFNNGAGPPVPTSAGGSFGFNQSFNDGAGDGPADSYSLSFPGHLGGSGMGMGMGFGLGPRSAGSRSLNGGGTGYGSSSSPSDTLLSSPLVQELFVDGAAGGGGPMALPLNADGSVAFDVQSAAGWNVPGGGGAPIGWSFTPGFGAEGFGNAPGKQPAPRLQPSRLDIDDDLFLLPPAGPLSAGLGQLSFEPQQQQQQPPTFQPPSAPHTQGLFPPPAQSGSSRRASVVSQGSTQRRPSGTGAPGGSSPTSAATMDAIHRAAREMLRQSMAGGQQQQQQPVPMSHGGAPSSLALEEISPKDTSAAAATAAEQGPSVKEDDEAFFAPAPPPGQPAGAKRPKPSKSRSKRDPIAPGATAGKSSNGLEAPAMQSEPSTTSAASANGDTEPATMPMISKRGKILSHAESLHNKVEKRYRSNVKNALESLRDAVPRLREIYGTSLPEEKLGVDAPDAQGNIGGLPSLGKPTKKTIMEGSRLYIEHLENEVHALSHRVARAEEALARFMNAQQIAAWQQGEIVLAAAVVNDVVADRERRARARAQMLGQAGGSASDDDDDDADAEEKRAAVKAGRNGKRKSDASGGDNSDSSFGKRSRSSIASKAGNAGVAALYSFGFAYSIYPFATDRVVRPIPQPATSSGRVIASSVAFGSHGTLDVPAPHTSLNRLALLVVTAISLLVVWPLLSALLNRITGVTSKAATARREELKQVTNGQRNAPIYNRILQVLRVGSLRGLFLEFGNVGKSRLGLSVWPASLREEEAWSRLLHAYAGGAIRCGALARLHIELRLWREGRSEPSQAILAALTTDDKSIGPEQWKHAQALALDYPENVTVARLLQASWSTCRSTLASVGPTDRPISVIADQLVVRQLANLFVQAFNDLVDDRVDTSAYRRAVSSALEGVPQGTEGSALGLVAISLGNVLNGVQNPALANLLLAEQSKGVAGAMRSADLVVRSLISLPPSAVRSAPLSALAAATDILATVCLKRALALTQDKEMRAHAAIEMRTLLADPALDALFAADESAFVANGDDDDTESVSTLDSGLHSVHDTPIALSAIDAAAEDRRDRFYTQMDRFVDALTAQCVLT